ncbi:MAG: hypothetical protein U0Q11_18195 [Vicinamibacterales bacterium]
MLTVDAWSNGDRLLKSAVRDAKWTSAGSTQVVLTDSSSKEQGPASCVRTAQSSTSARTAPAPFVHLQRHHQLLDPAGPDYPGTDNCAQAAPAALLHNGNILTQASWW